MNLLSWATLRGFTVLLAVPAMMIIGSCTNNETPTAAPTTTPTAAAASTATPAASATASATIAAPAVSATPTADATAAPTATRIPAGATTPTPPVALPSPTAPVVTATATATIVPATATPLSTATPTPYGPPAVNLGTAGNFVVLAKSGVSTIRNTSVVGDIGVSPISSTGITGFGLTMDASGTYSTSSLVTGRVYAPDYFGATASQLTIAVRDMETAYADAAGRTSPSATELGGGNIGGMTLVPGLYKWGTNVRISEAGLTLFGGPNDVWIFQIADNLDVASGAKINLAGGAQAKNIFWQVAGQATLGPATQVKGVILSQTAVIFNTGAALNGRALAQTAVTLDAGMATKPT